MTQRDENQFNKMQSKQSHGANQHEFLSVSITPLECSIVCEYDLGTSLFGPTCERIVKLGGSGQRDSGSISAETFVAISVEGSGMEAGQRLVSLLFHHSTPWACLETKPSA